MPDSVRLADMIDLALGTPEIGCVNFNVLHSFLHALLFQLQMQNIRTDLPDEKPFLTPRPKDKERRTGKGNGHARGVEATESEDVEEKKEEQDEERAVGGEGGIPFSDSDSGVTYGMDSSDNSGSSGQDKEVTEYSRSINISRTPYHRLEEKVQRLESRLRELDALPSNRELWERVGGGWGERQGEGKPQPVAEMWQSMQLSRKVDANTQGVSKLMSLVEDLMLQLHSLQQTSNDLKSKMEKSKQNDDLLQNLQKLVGQLEQKVKEFDDRINSEVLSGFVTWSALEDALKGLKQEFEPSATQQPDDFGFGSRHIDAVSSKELNASTEDLIRSTEQHLPTDADDAPDETGVRDLSYGNLRDLSRPGSSHRSRHMSTPGPSTELQDLLERLGKLTDRHEHLETRVDQLEIDVAKKADLELLRSLASDFERLSQQMRVANSDRDDLAEQLRRMLEDIEDLKGRQNGEYLNGQQQHLTDALQMDLDRLISSVGALTEDSLKHRDRLEDLQSLCRSLDERKADKEFILNEMNLGEWKSAFDQLNSDIGGKLDRLEFGPYCEELERQLRVVAKKIAALQSAMRGEGRTPEDAAAAAGLRKQLIQHFHCISCDRPLDVMAQKGIPTLPALPAVPEKRTNCPYLVYNQDSIRQSKHSYNWTPQNSDMVDVFATSRACGGSHTMTYPHRRIIRASNPGPGGLYADESPVRPLPPPPPYKSDAEVGSFSRSADRVTPAAVDGGTSASTSRLPNIHAMMNRGKHAQSSSSSASQLIRPSSAQQSFRPPLSPQNGGLIRSKTTMIEEDEDDDRTAVDGQTVGVENPAAAAPPPLANEGFQEED